MKNFIFGKNTITNALEHNDSLKRVLVSSSFKDDRIFKLLKNKKVSYRIVSQNEINSLVGNVNHQGVIAEIEEYKYISLEELIRKNQNNSNSLLVLLDGIEDPHNLGANGVIIGANRQVGLNSTVAKVSTGAIEYVDTCMVTNLNQTIQKLKEEGYWIVASDGEAKLDYRQVDYNNTKIVLVIGSEGFGVSKLLLKNSDFIVKIPMVGHVNSLNASVACAIFLAQIYNARNKL